MPVAETTTPSTAPDNAARSADRDAFPRQGSVMRVAVPASGGGVLSIDMKAIGLAGRHIEIVGSTVPLAYFFEAKKPGGQTTPDPAAVATFGADGARTANPATQAAQLAVGVHARRFVSPHFPMLQVVGVGGAGVIEIQDATI